MTTVWQMPIFFRWRKMCRALSPAQSVLDYHFIQNYDEYLWLILQCENKSKCCGLFARNLHLIWNTRTSNNIWKAHCYQTFPVWDSVFWRRSLNPHCLQPLPFHTAPWGGDRDRAVAVACIHQLIEVLVIQWTWCSRILLPSPLCLICKNL